MTIIYYGGYLDWGWTNDYPIDANYPTAPDGRIRRNMRPAIIRGYNEAGQLISTVREPVVEPEEGPTLIDRPPFFADGNDQQRVQAFRRAGFVNARGEPCHVMSYVNPWNTTFERFMSFPRMLIPFASGDILAIMGPLQNDALGYTLRQVPVNWPIQYIHYTQDETIFPGANLRDAWDRPWRIYNRDGSYRQALPMHEQPEAIVRDPDGQSMYYCGIADVSDAHWQEDMWQRPNVKSMSFSLTEWYTAERGPFMDGAILRKVGNDGAVIWSLANTRRYEGIGAIGFGPDGHLYAIGWYGGAYYANPPNYYGSTVHGAPRTIRKINPTTGAVLWESVLLNPIYEDGTESMGQYCPRRFTAVFGSDAIYIAGWHGRFSGPDGFSRSAAQILTKHSYTDGALVALYDAQNGPDETPTDEDRFSRSIFARLDNMWIDGDDIVINVRPGSSSHLYNIRRHRRSDLAFVSKENNPNYANRTDADSFALVKRDPLTGRSYRSTKGGNVIAAPWGGWQGFSEWHYFALDAAQNPLWLDLTATQSETGLDLHGRPVWTDVVRPGAGWGNTEYRLSERHNHIYTDPYGREIEADEDQRWATTAIALSYDNETPSLALHPAVQLPVFEGDRYTAAGALELYPLLWSPAYEREYAGPLASDLYRVTIGSITLAPTNWRCTRDGSRVMLMIVVPMPDAGIVVDLITRAGEPMTLDRGVAIKPPQYDALITATLEQVRSDRGPRSGSLTLVGGGIEGSGAPNRLRTLPPAVAVRRGFDGIEIEFAELVTHLRVGDTLSDPDDASMRTITAIEYGASASSAYLRVTAE